MPRKAKSTIVKAADGSVATFYDPPAPAPAPTTVQGNALSLNTGDNINFSIVGPSTAPRLSLLQIDEELYQLLTLLEEVKKDPLSVEGSITAIQDQIGLYAAKGEAKVNGIAYTHSTCLTASDICKRHAKHYSTMAKRWASSAESIEYSVHRTMLLTGTNEYKSAEHRLVLVGNGGVEPLDVNLEVMKEKSPGFVKVTVEMPLANWETLKLFNEEETRTAVVKDMAEDNAGTRAALAAGKTVTGARLLPRGNRVKIE